MKTNRIVCAVDFSETSLLALQHASSLAHASGATLYIVHVEQTPLKYSEGHARYQAELDEYRRLLHEAAPTRPSIDHEHHYLRGAVADELIQFAHYRHVDLIVLGTHGRTGLARLLMGSVAQEVVRRADCPVITVRGPAQHDVADAA